VQRWIVIARREGNKREEVTVSTKRVRKKEKLTNAFLGRKLDGEEIQFKRKKREHSLKTYSK